MKKILIIILVCSIFITSCKNENIQSNNLGEIQNIVSSEKKIPQFSIEITGLNTDTITNKDIQNLTLYNFETDIPAYDLDVNSTIYHEKWTGVKLKDVLEAKEIKNFRSINFKSIEKISVEYLNIEITDNTYLVFYHNDIALSESEKTPVMLITTNKKTRYWVPSLNKMKIN